MSNYSNLKPFWKKHFWLLKPFMVLMAPFVWLVVVPEFAKNVKMAYGEWLEILLITREE